MILTVRHIDGVRLVLDEKNFDSTILSGDTIFKIEKTESPNYIDISTPENWHLYGKNAANDYGVISLNIKRLLSGTTWNERSDLEKDLSFQYYTVGSENIISAMGYLMSGTSMTMVDAKNEMIKCWHKHHIKFVEACQQRWNYVKLTVPQYVSLVDGEDLLSDPVFNMLVSTYTSSGLMGTSWGDSNSGILDFIYSTGDYTGAGLEEKGYVLDEGYTWQDFKNAVNDVLYYGIYEKY